MLYTMYVIIINIKCNDTVLNGTEHKYMCMVLEFRYDMVTKDHTAVHTIICLKGSSFIP